MRNVLFAAVAILPLMSGAAFAGDEQIYEGPSLPVASAPALTETNDGAEFAQGPAVTLSISRTARNDTGDERETVFDGTPALAGGSAYAQK